MSQGGPHGVWWGWGQGSPRGALGVTEIPWQFRRPQYINSSDHPAPHRELLLRSVFSRALRRGKALAVRGTSRVGLVERWRRAWDLGFLEGKKGKDPDREGEVYFVLWYLRIEIELWFRNEIFLLWRIKIEKTFKNNCFLLVSLLCCVSMYLLLVDYLDESGHHLQWGSPCELLNISSPWAPVSASEKWECYPLCGLNVGTGWMNWERYSVPMTLSCASGSVGLLL